jgi:bleomycin hydrolase
MSNKKITMDMIKDYNQQFDSDINNQMIMNSIVKNGIQNVCIDYTSNINMQHNFSIDIKSGDITSQENSGRCWIFAGLNIVRWHIMKKLKLKTLELSQTYQMFFDKFEKANYFLESIMDTLDEETDSRLISHLLKAPVEDGGQWDMFYNTVEKYGVVPKAMMPESFESSHTQKMNWLLTLRLRKDACILREAHAMGTSKVELETIKAGMLKDIYFILCKSLGKPPIKFDFEYRNKDDEFFRECDLTPLSFYEKYMGQSLNDYVSLISAPTLDKPFMKSYTVSYLGNVIDKPVKYLNIEAEELKQVAISQLQDGEPVWFGCDVGKWIGESGAMDLDQFHYSEVFGTEFEMNKAQRLDYGESMMTHAMVFLGVNLKDGKANRWKVENSWGDKKGNKGYFIMSDDWFSEYLYQVVVPKKYLTPEMIKAYNTAPIVLKPWDPMGSLAK